MATFAERLKSLRREKSWSQQRLADELELSKSSVNMYERGEREPGFETMEAIADLFNVDMNYLYGRTDIKIADPIVLDHSAAPAPRPIPKGFEPMPKMKKIPLVGSIACGTPILAQQNIEKIVDVPESIRCDFSLTCHGDSMEGAGIHDRDVVYIRIQPEVENGEIAAVRIGEEATLKHFHRQGDTVMLLADNAAVCPPMVYTGPQLNEIRIEGRAVGFCRGL